MSFKVLTGSKLKAAIAGYGKTVATFSARTHQLAFSAISHVDLHHCPSHLNALYQATPTNYRGAIRKYACAFGKVEFDKDSMSFTYKKDGKSDLDAALTVSPADYEKETKTGAPKATSDLLTRLERLAKKELESDAGQHDLAQALQNFVTLQRRAAIQPVTKAA